MAVKMLVPAYGDDSDLKFKERSLGENSESLKSHHYEPKKEWLCWNKAIFL